MSKPRKAPPIHGTYARYVSKGCRCDDCRTAARSYHQQWRASRRGTLPDDDPRHGTVNGHNNYGCRCDRCLAAQYRRLSEYWLGMAVKLEKKAGVMPRAGSVTP